MKSKADLVGIRSALLTEVERLRGENEKVLGALESANQTAERRGDERDLAQAQAARMAEALGELEYVADKLRGGGYYPYADAAVDIDAVFATSSGPDAVACLRWLLATEKRAAAAELIRVAGSRYVRKGGGLAERLQIVVSNAHLVSQDLDVVTSTDLRDRAADLTDEAAVLEGK